MSCLYKQSNCDQNWKVESPAPIWNQMTSEGFDFQTELNINEQDRQEFTDANNIIEILL